MLALWVPGASLSIKLESLSVRILRGPVIVILVFNGYSLSRFKIIFEEASLPPHP
ncbi:hypothetical protein D3C78_1793480 [compost metagenome]